MTFLDDPNLTPPTLSLVFGAFFLGGLVKGMIGFGLPLIAVSVLAHFLPPPLVFRICVVPPFFLNILQVGSVAAARRSRRASGRYCLAFSRRSPPAPS